MSLRRLLSFCAAASTAALVTVASCAQSAAATTFHNPLLTSGPDPWVMTEGNFYYYMNTTGRNLTLRRTHNIADLAHAETRVVWTPPANGPYSKQIWAPELHRMDGKWYIYFAADRGDNESHRIYVVENASANPMEGEWTFKGKVNDVTNKWAIDATVFEDRGQKYMLWSGWQGDDDGEQRIYIAHLRNPWTIDSPRTELSRSDHPWERVGDLPDRPAMPHVNVNEGPEILRHGDRIFLVYSASACWTDYYELGLLQTEEGMDLLRAESWTKLDRPVFREDTKAGVYATGHNGFFRSLDGKENWIIYHANSAPHQGCGNTRSPRMQPFTWDKDGMPDFGTPVPLSTELQAPGGN